ncbi:MAG TPA: hypothetical protein VKM54_25775 [Myxococcota bacterium]|nr:hypothetical protein [Myxococcota bacterium]
MTFFSGGNVIPWRTSSYPPMGELEYKPLPLTTDQTIMVCCQLVGRIRGTIVDLALDVLHQATSRPFDKYAKIAYLLLQRAMECLFSIELLIMLERERDAAVLLVTLLELSYDVRFAERQPNRIDEWVRHKDRNRKPWRVGQLLRALYTDDGERESARAVYEHCSMIKHSNPAGGTLTMPLGVDGRMIIARANDTRDLLAAYAFTAGGTAYEAAKAALKIWERAGFAIDSNPLETAWRELSTSMEQRLIAILKTLRQDHQDQHAGTASRESQ